MRGQSASWPTRHRTPWTMEHYCAVLATQLGSRGNLVSSTSSWQVIMYLKDIFIRIPNWLGRSLCCFYLCDMIKYYFLFPANVSETHNDNIRHLPNISKLNKQHTYHISYAERFFCWDNIKSICSSEKVPIKASNFFVFLLRRYIITEILLETVL